MDMTTREKKEILLKYRSTVREIEWLEREIQKWRSNAERMTASYHAAPASGGSNRRSIEEAVEQIDKLIRRFMDYQSDLIRTRGMIENAIESLRDPVLQEVLQMRYLDGLNFHQIAGKLGYSDRHLVRLHRAALEKMSLNCLLYTSPSPRDCS